MRPLATQITGFLKELHSIRVRGNGLRSVPRYSQEEWIKSTRLQYNKIRRITYPLLEPKLRAQSEEFWRELLADLAEASFRPTLIHGDLGTENMLIDPTSAKLTGILDWGYTQVSDPALEFAHLFLHQSDLGEEVLKL
jgi:aminoglycoside 2''-phosphotransferase